MKPLNVHQSIIDKSHMHASTKVRPDYVAPLKNKNQLNNVMEPV